MRTHGSITVAVALCLAMVAAERAGAQSARIEFVHSAPGGVVGPGETVQITMRLSWTQGWTLGTVFGDAVATPDVGVAANPASGFAPAFGGAVVAAGQPTLGSIRGFGAGVAPGSQLFPGAFTQGWAGIDALAFEWTAPSQPQQATFDFEFVPSVPTVQLYPGGPGAPLEPVPTTVVPATLTVVPSPAPLVVLGVAGGLSTRRRRVGT